MRSSKIFWWIFAAENVCIFEIRGTFKCVPFEGLCVRLKIYLYFLAVCFQAHYERPRWVVWVGGRWLHTPTVQHSLPCPPVTITNTHYQQQQSRRRWNQQYNHYCLSFDGFPGDDERKQRAINGWIQSRRNCQTTCCYACIHTYVLLRWQSMFFNNIFLKVLYFKLGFLRFTPKKNNETAI